MKSFWASLITTTKTYLDKMENKSAKYLDLTKGHSRSFKEKSSSASSGTWFRNTSRHHHMQRGTLWWRLNCRCFSSMAKVPRRKCSKKPQKERNVGFLKNQLVFGGCSSSYFCASFPNLISFKRGGNLSLLELYQSNLKTNFDQKSIL